MQQAKSAKLEGFRRLFCPSWHRTFPFKSYLVNHEKKFVYCPIPKVACTSIKHWFYSLLSSVDSDECNTNLHSKLKDKYSLARLRPQEAQQILASYYTFAFIREPFSRIESAYNNKFVRKQKNTVNKITIPVIEWVYSNLREKKIKKTKTFIYFDGSGRKYETAVDPDIDYQQSINFREFVIYLCTHRDVSLNQHWKAQIDFLPNGNPIDLFTLENLDYSTSLLAQKLRIQSIQLPTLNVSKNDSQHQVTRQNFSNLEAGDLRNIPSDSVELYTSDLRTMIKKRYAKDFDLYEKATLQEKTHKN